MICGILRFRDGMCQYEMFVIAHTCKLNVISMYADMECGCITYA